MLKNNKNLDIFNDKLISIRRTVKVVKGGRIFGFDALIVTGDKKGKVGFGRGKSKEISLAIQKAAQKARKNISFIHIKKPTIYYNMLNTQGTTKILMKPAKKGTGIIASNSMRAVFKAAGIKNVVAKCIGSNNPINVVSKTINMLKNMKKPSYYKIKLNKSGNNDNKNK